MSKRRNPYAKSLRVKRPQVVRPRKGRGAPKRPKHKGEDDE